MIINKIPFDFHQRKNKNKALTKKNMVNRVKFIELEGVRLALTLNDQDYDHAYNQVYLK